jgi:Raf kinase inhibitor-like YbhB/YbcL family protein
MPFTLTSPAFADGARIPDAYTCSGDDKSPALAWWEVPAGTRTLALVVDDPDAPRGTFTHWVVWNLPADGGGLPEGRGKGGALPAGALEGANSAGERGYVGPCPPPGGPHRYVFTLHALDAELQLPAGASRDRLLRAASGHELGRTQLTGLYERR